MSNQEYVTEQKVRDIVRESTQEIIEAIGVFSNDIGIKLDKIDGRLDKVEGRLDKVEGRLDKVEGRLDKVEGKLDKVETEMVGLRFSVTKSLELSDARYLELRQQNKELFKFVIQLAKATNAQVPTEDLEKRFATAI